MEGIQNSTFNPIYMGSDTDYMGHKLEVITSSCGQIVNKRMDEHSKKFVPKVYKVGECVYASVGTSLNNCIMIEGSDGLIMVDSDDCIEAAQLHLAEFRKISDKPIKGVIYTHFHYVSGTAAYVNPADMDKIPIWAHEKHMHSIMDSAMGDVTDAYYKKTNIWHGHYLPKEGTDAMDGEGLGPVCNNKHLPVMTFGYLPPNHFIPENGMTKTTICGVDFEFYPATCETDDSIIIWMPQYKISIDNHAWPTFANLYSLRGTPYRDPLGWIKGIDILRSLKPEHLISGHGIPLEGKEHIYDVLIQYRDSIQYVYDWTVIEINKGKSAEEIIAGFKIPERLSNGPLNSERYGEIDYYIRGIYDGLIGWYGNDPVELHRLTPSYEAMRMVDAFGGEKKATEIARKALNNCEYIWSAQVAGYVVRANPENTEAKQIKADAFRGIAQRTTASGTRAFYLHAARTLEGKINLGEVHRPISPDLVMALPPDTFVRKIRLKVNMEKIFDINGIVLFRFSDKNLEYVLHIRYGIIEFLESIPEHFDVKFEMSFSVFAKIAAGESLAENIKNGGINVSGAVEKCNAVISALD